MRDDELLQVAGDWSFWDRSPPSSVRRAVGLPKTLSNRTALVIQGVRRCGKSTLLTQLIDRYRLKRRDCLFVNFEDPRLSGSLGFETLERLTGAFAERRPGEETLTILLDEVQWVDGWEKWLRTKLERPGRFRFVVSGSNSRLLSGELSSVLTGRHITVELFPFDLAEFRLLYPSAPDCRLPASRRLSRTGCERRRRPLVAAVLRRHRATRRARAGGREIVARAQADRANGLRIRRVRTQPASDRLPPAGLPWRPWPRISRPANSATCCSPVRGSRTRNAGARTGTASTIPSTPPSGELR